MGIRSKSEEEDEGLNMTSLLDVLFILIIFFLVTTTFKQKEDDRRVQLPVDDRNQPTSAEAGKVLKVNILKEGEYVILGKQVTPKEMDAILQDEVKRRPEVKVMIRADVDSKHGRLATVLNSCRFFGVKDSHILVRSIGEKKKAQ